MDHQKNYDAIVQKAKNENRKKLNKNKEGYIYYENHHIIPKCLSGTNDKQNLVLLTAREHFICHKLLTYIYTGNRKIICAFHLMTFMNKRKYGITSRDYAYAIELFRSIPKDNSGKKNPMYGKTTVITPDGISKSISINDSLYLNGTYISSHARENNGMFGTNSYKIWVEKYGVEEANKRMQQYKKNISKSLKLSPNVNNTGMHNPMYNNTPYNVWVEKYGVEEADKRKKQWQKNLSGKILYHNNNLQKRKYLKPEEIEAYKNMGWIKGEGKFNIKIKNI